MFRVARKIRVGRETGNTHIFFLGLKSWKRTVSIEEARMEHFKTLLYNYKVLCDGSELFKKITLW